MKIRWNDESASILLSALMFLMVISTLLTGFGIIVQNESRQMQLLKNNYIAKAMIQKAHQITLENTNSIDMESEVSSIDHTIRFNHGRVKVDIPSENILNYTAELNNNYTYEQQFQYIGLSKEDEQELNEFGSADISIEDNGAIINDEAESEEYDPKEQTDDSKLNLSDNTF